MRLKTTSEAISFLKELEKISSGFYECLARDHEEQKDLFTGFVKENEKNVKNIERTYFGVITDALEGCFAFDIDPSIYNLDQKCVLGGNYRDALSRSVEVETTIRQFYLDAAAQSKCLMADVPRVMERIAKARGERQKKLEALLEGVK